LARIGLEVFLAENAPDGLRKAALLRPDTILLEYWLGGIDGLTWLRKLRQAITGRMPNLILWSADWDLNLTGEAGELGAVYVDKCLDLAELKELISPGRGRHSAGSEAPFQGDRPTERFRRTSADPAQRSAARAT
jgi:DNA-binding response OmpR family regulator